MRLFCLSMFVRCGTMIWPSIRFVISLQIFKKPLDIFSPQIERKRFKEYRKIPKISPGAYIFQRPFLRGLFLEGLIFGGAYVRREICVSKSIGLACCGKEIYHFCFVLLCSWGQIPCTSPPGAYIRRGDLTEGFLRYNFEGLIHGGASFRSFTVFSYNSGCKRKVWAIFLPQVRLWKKQTPGSRLKT